MNLNWNLARIIWLKNTSIKNMNCCLKGTKRQQPFRLASKTVTTIVVTLVQCRHLRHRRPAGCGRVLRSWSSLHATGIYSYYLIGDLKLRMSSSAQLIGCLFSFHLLFLLFFFARWPVLEILHASKKKNLKKKITINFVVYTICIRVMWDSHLSFDFSPYQ